MRLNAKRDGLRYARVPMGGETCSFCAMLASRGFDYRSAKTAGEGNHYHKNCRCKVVPGFDGMEVEGYDPDEWHERWQLMEEIQADTSLSWNERQFGKLAVSEGMSLEEWRAVRKSLEVDMSKIGTKNFRRGEGRLRGQSAGSGPCRYQTHPAAPLGNALRGPVRLRCHERKEIGERHHFRD